MISPRSSSRTEYHPHPHLHVTTLTIFHRNTLYPPPPKPKTISPFYSLFHRHPYCSITCCASDHHLQIPSPPIFNLIEYLQQPPEHLSSTFRPPAPNPEEPPYLILTATIPAYLPSYLTTYQRSPPCNLPTYSLYQQTSSNRAAFTDPYSIATPSAYLQPSH
ncbi:hypothetical protein NE237_027615 [Protea cynaroides]|uniref:Uncharacterized protein n=1 Tax=Protea cynaroides TaxID=273540 RepID=A0A9Q0GQH2_9MAGN|nr:hypothetical protein NE237_027615 [Protea cynaroides]